MGFLDRKKERIAAEKEASRSPTASTEVISATLASFKERAKKERKRYVDATDSEYWVALCFQSREAKEQFLRDHALDDLGDKYLDGAAVDAKLKTERK